MDKRQAADSLDEIAVLLDLAGENPFKGRAFAAAARAVRAYPGDLAQAVESGEVRSIKGVGEHIARVTAELVTGGHSPYLDELRTRFPPGVLEMLRIPGLGPRKVRVLADQLGISSVGELEYACRENRLLTLPGFGTRTQENILAGIARLAAGAGRHLALFVLREAEELAGDLRRAPGVQRLEVAGSLRRRRETVKDIDLVASVRDPRPLMDALARHAATAEVTARGGTKMQVRLKSGLPLDLRVVEDASFPCALLHFTGSKEHNVALRSLALDRGLSLNEYGLFKGKRTVPCRDETAIYRRLGLAFIPPELREDLGEIEAAEKGELPELVAEKDLRGALHAHTVASDGSATLEEMAEAARALGWSWLGIAEHSRSARYARGLTAGRLRTEGMRIAALNDKLDGFTLLHGAEVDILPDGSLDYPDSVLDSLDFVIGSVHSHFTLGEKEQTARLCRALTHPGLDVLGHPSGRLLLTRDPYAVDLEKVLACAARNGKTVEFNAHPHRLDLDWRLLRRARELGVPVCVNPDAHGTGDLAYARDCLGTVRKGWMTRADLLNSLTAKQVLARFAGWKRRVSGKEKIR